MDMTGNVINVFCSYAHVDEDLMKELYKHLSLLRRSDLINCWYDRMIIPGEEWQSKIDDNINTANIILLLISADFLNSDYCYGAEMACALKRYEAQQAYVIPIFLRKCDWKNAPFAKIQGLPKDAIPVKSWPNLDEAFTDVSIGIRLAVEKLVNSLRQKKKLTSQTAPVQEKENLATIKEIIFTIGSGTFVVCQKNNTNTAPYIKNDRIYISVRQVALALGVDGKNILWNENDQSMIIIKNDFVVKISKDSNIMFINGVPITMDVPPEIISGVVMLPLRWIAQALSTSVAWDAATMSIIFTVLG